MNPITPSQVSLAENGSAIYLLHWGNTKTRPRFERKREQKAANEGEMSYGIPPPQKRMQKVAEPHAAYVDQQHAGKPLPNYGVDITTLTAMLGPLGASTQFATSGLMM